MPDDKAAVGVSRDSFEAFTKRVKTQRDESEEQRNARATRMEFYRRMRR